MQNVRNVSLRDNRMRGKGSSTIIESLRDHSELVTLDLSTNHLGRLGMLSLSRNMIRFQSLKSLDLSRNKINDHDIEIFTKVMNDASDLESLNLSDNNIASDGAVAVGKSLNTCNNLQMLDLSWNAIRGKGVAVIGESLVTNTALTDLRVAWNAFGGSTNFDIWAQVFEFNTTLCSLDLRHNGIDERNCIVISENLKWNVTIQKLYLDDNPLGPVGAKLAFKIMDTFGENRSLSITGCNFEARSRMCDFDPSACKGQSFSLDLSMPYDRSVALALVRIAGKSILEQWQSPKLDGAAVDVTLYESKGEQLPRQGTLTLTYMQFEQSAKRENVVNVATFNKLTAMVSAQDRAESDRLGHLKQICEEIDLTSQQLAAMLDEAKLSSRGKISLILDLFSRIVDREEFYEVEEKLTRKELARLRLELGPMWSFSESNATGHYKLNLKNPFDRDLAAKVLSVNNYERQVRKDARLADTSDDGFYMNFRNETYNGETFKFDPSWTVPETGILEFDYVSTTRPPWNAEPLSKDLFFELLHNLSDHTISDTEKLEYVLRPYSNDEYFTTDQLRQIVQKFREPGARVDAVVMCHRRILDLENFLRVIMLELRSLGPKGEKWTDFDPASCQGIVPKADDDMEINVVLSRLGWLNCWNPLDPDIMYRINLGMRDERTVAECLVNLAVKEPGENWVGEFFNGNVFELPSTWVKEVPHKGILEVHYFTDQLSQEALSSKSKRGDNFELRVKWFKKTLCYGQDMKIDDDGFEGIPRDKMSTHRNWKIRRVASEMRHLVVEVLDSIRHQNVRWLQKKGFKVIEGGDPNNPTMQSLRTGARFSFDELLARQREIAIQSGKFPRPLATCPEEQEEEVPGQHEQSQEVSSENTSRVFSEPRIPYQTMQND